ncbi:GNAT family N-acetyltransferase [Chitinophaga sp. G-6-1-13]|uniref:GNAT family N-acetyltransferase n=1 Tax=Chitinophaga fulva TaxID=2728842 RepID=A0A848GRH7_9BACT|nr:GNAT family N-acetyltransferase [Chitinophaga fulva]NML39682.1 GNAT family N-acetyltransferase [Chitinophaga fulva]
MALEFRKATSADADQIWNILEKAIARRKAEGSDQWQDGYPNPAVVASDIENSHGFVLAADDKIAGYIALLINDEPAYADIKGTWLTDGDFVVYHRVAISDDFLGQGLAQQMLKHVEDYAMNNHINSVRADTNHDNKGMLRIFEKLGYVYCGEVFFRGASRLAFEKVLP